MSVKCWEPLVSVDVHRNTAKIKEKKQKCAGQKTPNNSVVIDCSKSGGIVSQSVAKYIYFLNSQSTLWSLDYRFCHTSRCTQAE